MSAPPPRTSLNVRVQILERIDNVNVVRAICKQLGARDAEIELFQHAIAETLQHTRWLRDNEAWIREAAQEAKQK